MIKLPTVLVLGAGASNPYGYPVGQKLVDDIIMEAANDHSPLFKDLTEVTGHDFVGVDVKRFSVALKRSGCQSVDAFLAGRTNFTEMGRCAITSQLLRCEKPDFIHGKDVWYRYLYEKMRDPNQFESFGASQVSIVTFNYDRSLEYFLFTALKNNFQKTPAECVQNFEKIPIIHVHGRLGPSPTLEHEWPPYGGKPIKPTDLSSLAKQIKIIHENEDDTPEFADARGVLGRAERICFLGFGFHETNLRRLFKGVKPSSGVKILSSNFDFTESEKADIQSHLPLPTCDWGERERTCKDFLRDKGVLLG